MPNPINSSTHKGIEGGDKNYSSTAPVCGVQGVSSETSGPFGQDSWPPLSTAGCSAPDPFTPVEGDPFGSLATSFATPPRNKRQSGSVGASYGDEKFDAPVFDLIGPRPSLSQSGEAAPKWAHASAEKVVQLLEMGVAAEEATAVAALKANDDCVERAIEWIFSGGELSGSGGTLNDFPRSGPAAQSHLSDMMSAASNRFSSIDKDYDNHTWDSGPGDGSTGLSTLSAAALALHDRDNDARLANAGLSSSWGLGNAPPGSPAGSDGRISGGSNGDLFEREQRSRQIQEELPPPPLRPTKPFIHYPGVAEESHGQISDIIKSGFVNESCLVDKFEIELPSTSGQNSCAAEMIVYRVEGASAFGTDDDSSSGSASPPPGILDTLLVVEVMDATWGAMLVPGNMSCCSHYLRTNQCLLIT